MVLFWMNTPHVKKHLPILHRQFNDMGASSYVESAVLIIGGGISGELFMLAIEYGSSNHLIIYIGMCAAIELCRRGTTRDIIIIEKSNGFGGTW